MCIMLVCVFVVCGYMKDCVFGAFAGFFCTKFSHYNTGKEIFYIHQMKLSADEEARGWLI